MNTHILIFNCGSSSLTYKLYRVMGEDKLEVAAQGKAHHVATKSQEQPYILNTVGNSTWRESMPLPNHREAAQAILAFLERAGLPVDVCGHRFVHGGAHFRSATIIAPHNLPDLEACNPLAPLQNPGSVSVLKLCAGLRPQSVQYASFDTAFHAGLPEYAYRYALPEEITRRYGFRKYGFHGLSYHYCTLQTARFLERPVESLKIVACHLGTGGSSAVAIRNGQSLDTSMGYTPLQGLIMSTRSGDIDPAVVLELIEAHGYTAAQVNRLLNKEGGLIGISQISSDPFELLQQMPTNPHARLAIEMYVHRLKSYIGAYLALLGGADALVFTDEIGLRGWQIRELACAGMQWCGLALDPQANREAPTDQVARLSAADSPITVLSVPTDEEYVIALQGLELMK